MSKDKKMYADDKHMVKINDDEEMSVKELVDCYNDMKKKHDDAGLESDEEALEALEELEEHEEEEILENDDDSEEKKKDDKKKNAKEAKEKAKKNFEALKNARQNAQQPTETYMSSKDKVALGKELF